MSLMTRARLLRGSRHDNSADIRPPWAVDAVFSEKCDGCGDCITACGQNILRLNAARLPVVDFSEGPCTFCGDCETACKTGALVRTMDRTGPPKDQPWLVTAEVTDKCLALQGTPCIRCLEACEQDVISARPMMHGRTAVSIDAAGCTGCGACFAGCPVEAISLRVARGLEQPETKPVRISL